MAEPITTPGVYPDVPEEDYHRDPVKGGSLSSSGARRLLECPAKFRWEQENPPPPKAAFDIGSAAHKLVLGAGPELEVIDADNWQTKAAREARDAARAAGKIPVLTHEHETVTAMAEAIRRHPIASRLLDPERGDPEQTLVWECEQTGVNCRARLDWLPRPTDGRLILSDYKTSVSAEPTSFAKSVANYGYHQQDPWYIDGVRTLGLGGADTAFLFVVQEKTPPYVVTIFELDTEARRIGVRRNLEARLTYARCTDTDHWPTYTDQIELLSLPAWATHPH